MSLQIKDLLLIGLLALCLGCGQRDKIARYTVRKPELVDPTLVAASSAPKSPATEQQTLGLIVPVGEQSWFFKLTGDVKAVAPQHEAFLQFVMSIKFVAGREGGPTWSLPAGWKELPGSGFRFATIQVPADGKPLEISVSSAGGDVLSNVNRWRNQLNLKPVSADELATSAKTLKVGGREATLVSLVGTGSGGMGGGAPFAPFAGGATLPADHPPVGKGSDGGTLTPSLSQREREQAASGGKISFDAPPEWTPAAKSAFSVAAFKVTEGDKQVEITVSSAGGDMLANVNRWRGQLGLEPIDATELAKIVEEIDTLGVSGAYVELAGPAGAAKRESILGVRADAGGQTWFVKLKGDAELAQREKSRFEAFVKSLMLP